MDEGGRSTSPLLPSSIAQTWKPAKSMDIVNMRTSSWLVGWAALRPLRRKLAVVLILAMLGCVPLFTNMSIRSAFHERTDMRGDIPLRSEPESEVVEDVLPAHLRPGTYLRDDNVTSHFRDRLRSDTGYITSFLSAGWTNDQITIGNLIYLSLITGKIPILPPFTSSIDADAAPLPYSEIFDIPRMSAALGIPILEWHQVKDFGHSRDQTSPDEIGCWNIWEVDNMESDGPRWSFSTVLLNLDISYTRAPASVKLIPSYEHDSHSTFWSLAKLAFPEGRSEALSNPHDNPTRPSERGGVMLPPDQQLLCYDYLYYVCAFEPFDFVKDYSPLWREVMIHAHWNRKTVELAQSYLRRIFGLSEVETIPPFIAIHARRRDFLGWCGDVLKDDCFAPLSAYARRVREVQDELRERYGLSVTHVIMTGDERDETWWADVEAQGWLRIDHRGLRIAETHGNWYPVVLDAVVQSMAMGLVGTDRSTFSHMSQRRVADWNRGATRMVKWGHIGADDH